MNFRIFGHFWCESVPSSNEFPAATSKDDKNYPNHLTYCNVLRRTDAKILFNSKMTDTIEKLRLLKGISRTVMPPKLIVFSQTKLKEILANWNHILGFTIQFLIMALILTSVVGPKAPFRMALLQRV
jgi:hypothetical protein